MTLNEHVGGLLVVVREPQRVTLLNTSSVDFTGFTALPRDHPTAPEHRRLICWFADTDVKPPGFSNVERGQRTEVNGESTSDRGRLKNRTEPSRPGSIFCLRDHSRHRNVGLESERRRLISRRNRGRDQKFDSEDQTYLEQTVDLVVY